MYSLKPSPFGEEATALRLEVRNFLQRQRADGRFRPICDAWVRGADREFSKLLGSRGWLGLTWPRRYGGKERPQRERFAVIEELLAAGAPVASHWVAERQIGPTLLRHGTEEQRQTLLPAIARGECVVAVGYSEPDVGSDLAAVRTRATRVSGGWRISGTKVWTSQAHDADRMTVLCRTSEQADKRKGLSLLLTRLPNDGVTIRPIELLNGEHHFNEVVFEDAFVAEAMVIGEVDDGWRVVTSDLAYERSGPERYMSTFPLLAALIDKARSEAPDAAVAAGIGKLAARFESLRAMSIAIAEKLDRGEAPDVEAALVKDMGTRFEGDVAEVARTLFPAVPDPESGDDYERLLAEAIVQAPAFTLRGGTNEILRGIIARGLGLR